MRKAVTLPSTSRDWTEASALSRGAAKLKRDREAKAASSALAATLQDQQHEHGAIARCGSHSIRRSCSAGVALVTAPDSGVVRSDTQQHQHALIDTDRVHFGWLCVAVNASKRAFRWRFCVVDGAQLSIFRDNQRDAECLGHHTLTAAERLHCVNRGLLLTDDAQRAIWAHADHDTAHFETWLSVFREGIQFAQQYRASSIFARPLSRLGDASSSARCKEELDVGFTGWLLLRRRRLGLFLSAQRHYIVLSGRYLSVFTVNLEGERAKVCGRVVTAAPHKCSHWLSVALEGGQHIHLASPHPEITASWLARMQQALEREM